MTEFEDGDLVKLLPGSRYYHQAPDEIGVIILGTTLSLNWAKITFKNGYSNSYPMTDIVLVEPKSTKTNLNKRVIDILKEVIR